MYLRTSKRILWKQQRKIARRTGTKYGELSNEKKGTKREYGRNRYRTMSEEDNQKLKEYQKTIVTHKINISLLYIV